MSPEDKLQLTPFDLLELDSAMKLFDKFVNDMEGLAENDPLRESKAKDIKAIQDWVIGILSPKYSKK